MTDERRQLLIRTLAYVDQSIAKRKALLADPAAQQSPSEAQTIRDALEESIRARAKIEAELSKESDQP